MHKLKVATVFSGIGSFEFSLRRLGIDHEIVFACDNGGIEIEMDSKEELNKIKVMNNEKEKKEYVDDLYKLKSKKKNYVKLSYLANYNICEDKFYQDIRLLDGTDYKDRVDILVGGSPCQSFSTVGYQSGLEDARGTLFYDFARIIDETQPKVFIYENVRGLLTHDKKNTWEIVYNILKNIDNYNLSYKVLNSKNFGIPQNRNRLFVVGIKNSKESFTFPKEKELLYSLNDFRIENADIGNFNFDDNGNILINQVSGKVDPKYKLSKSVQKYVLSGGTKNFYQKPEIDLEIARPILATMNNKHRAGIDNYFTYEDGVRTLTEREALRLMGFTDDFKIDVSKSQIYKQAGNSIVVDIFIEIIREMTRSSII